MSWHDDASEAADEICFGSSSGKAVKAWKSASLIQMTELRLPLNHFMMDHYWTAQNYNDKSYRGWENENLVNYKIRLNVRNIEKKVLKVWKRFVTVINMSRRILKRLKFLTRNRCWLGSFHRIVFWASNQCNEVAENPSNREEKSCCGFVS